MAPTEISLTQFRALRPRRVSRYKLLSGQRVFVKLDDGRRYIVSNVVLESGRNNLRFISDSDRLVVYKARPRDRVNILLSAIGLVATLVGLGISLLPSLSRRPPTIDQRLKQLSSIQQSLSELGAYVADQQTTLTQLTRDVNRLQHERESLTRVVQLDRASVEALLQYQTAQQRQREYISVVLSFLVGVLSSITAAFALRLLHKRNEPDGDPTESP